MKREKPIKWISYFDEPHEILGWIGALCILAAYAFTSLGWMNPQAYGYQTLNLFGAFGLLVNAYKNKAYPSFILNIIWMAIGIYVLTQLFLAYIN